MRARSRDSLLPSPGQRKKSPAHRKGSTLGNWDFRFPLVYPWKRPGLPPMPIPARTGISSGVPLVKNQHLLWCLSRKDWDLLCCPHSRQRDMWHWAVGAAGHLCLPSGPSHASWTVFPLTLGRAIGPQHPLNPLSPGNVPWGGTLGDGISFGVHSFSPLLLGYSQPPPCALHPDEVPHLRAQYAKEFPDPELSDGVGAVPLSLWLCPLGLGRDAVAQD